MTGTPDAPHRAATPRRVLVAFIVAGCCLANSGCGKTDAPAADQSARSAPAPESLVASMTPAAPAAGMMSTPFIVPPVTDPPMSAAADVNLRPEVQVIGVSIAGISRAWLISAMSDMQSHVVIDTRGPQPIAVTFCDRSRCTRVLAGQPGAALQVQTAGFINGEMWLRVNGQMLPQSSTDVPLEDIEAVVTTWQEWNASHPDTTVYLPRESEKAE